MTFDLREEPWIPVILLNGDPAELSLKGCFIRAAEVRRIAGEIPTQSFALLRLLLAITHDAIGFHDEDAVASAMRDGIDADAVVEYLNGWEDRFDLFHPTRPFYQVASLHTAKGDISGLEKLIVDVPNGHPFMTMRSGAAIAQISAAEAARWLVHCQAFDPSGIRSGVVGDPEVKGGKSYPIGPSWAGQIGGVVIHGASLAETLPYNLVATPGGPADRPVWTWDEPPTERRVLEGRPAGPVSVLTWQSRRIRLAGDRAGVTGVVLSNGDKLTPHNRVSVEFMTAWRYSDPQTKKAGIDVYMPLKHDPERLGWRGLPALISEGPEEKGKIRTLPVKTLMTVRSQEDEQEDLDQRVGVEIVGMTYGPQEATVEELVNDSFDLRVPLLGERAAPVRTALHDCVANADAAVRALGFMAVRVAQAAGDHDGVEGARDAATAEAWAALDAPVRVWLSDLSADTTLAAMRRDFQMIVRRVLERQAAAIGDRCSPAAITGRETSYGFMSAAKAEAIFRSALRAQIPLAYPQPTPEENHDD